MNKLIILIVLLLNSTLFAAYNVKIGVYKNAKNLRAKVSKIKSNKYRKKVLIEKKGRLYYAHAIVATSKEARDALHAYRGVFEDAFIDKKQVQMKKKKRKKTSKPSKQKSTKSKSIKPKNKKVKKLKTKMNAHALLDGKTVYLCYDKSPKRLKDRVVKLVFSEKMLSYIPLGNNGTKLELGYGFNEDKLTLNLPDMNITHEINAIKEGYLEASNRVEGEKIYTLRYYFDEEDAWEFVKRP